MNVEVQAREGREVEEQEEKREVQGWCGIQRKVDELAQLETGAPERSVGKQSGQGWARRQAVDRREREV